MLGEVGIASKTRLVFAAGTRARGRAVSCLVEQAPEPHQILQPGTPAGRRDPSPVRHGRPIAQCPQHGRLPGPPQPRSEGTAAVSSFFAPPCRSCLRWPSWFLSAIVSSLIVALGPTVAVVISAFVNWRVALRARHAAIAAQKGARGGGCSGARACGDGDRYPHGCYCTRG